MFSCTKIKSYEYDEHKPIGQGGFGIVYKAKCTLRNQYVAIKKIKKPNNKSSVKRVQDEVLIHSKLSHSSILHLYESFEDNEHIYLVLELCEINVQQYIKRLGRPLSENEAREFLKEIVDGMLYLHTEKIMHRDLKLSNLLLDAKNQIKIADFGLATQLKTPKETHTTMCGTPNYISPQVATRESYGLETDVWSLGIMLYEMVVGKLPFEQGVRKKNGNSTDNVKEILSRILDGTYPLPKYLSEECRDLICKCIKTNVKERIQLCDIKFHPFLVGPYNKESDIMCNAKSTDSSGFNRNDPYKRNYFHPSSPPERLKSDPKDIPEFMRNSLFHATNYKGPFFMKPPDILPPLIPPRFVQSQSRSQERNCAIKANHNISNYNSRIKVRSRSNEVDCNMVENKPSYHTTSMQSQSKSTILSNLGPPVSTVRLKPIRMPKNNKIFHILKSLEVCIEFLTEDQQWVNLVCRVSADGMIIRLYKPFDGAVSNYPPPLPRRYAQYSYDTLPRDHWNKYRYASRFVDLVKARTARIKYYSKLARCRLMENFPDPTFEASFYEGTKVVISANGVQINDKTYSNDGILFSLCETEKQLYEHAEKIRSICLKHNEIEETNDDCPFPMRFGRPPSNEKQQNKENISPQSEWSTVSSNVTRRPLSALNSNIPNSKAPNGKFIKYIGAYVSQSNGEICFQFKDNGKILKLSNEKPEEFYYAKSPSDPLDKCNTANLTPSLTNYLSQVYEYIRQ